ncbi:uncharacterized protein RJT21DRAFT_121990 [Scheffersomyces amazonensis]|uniref:uncharacterized protein n=1 Tax=Scheffersomyces amazonensis TaxID=1078765 RepID=UPI00315D4A25
MYSSTLVTLVIFLLGVLASETPTIIQEPSTTSLDPTETPSTIIDILSSQAQYSYFLRYIQRKGLVPIINSLNNITLFAPINSAFIESQIDDFDNNELLRYIVNQKFRVGYSDEREMVLNTLYRLSDKRNYTLSIVPDLQTYEYVVDNVSAIVDPDIYAKHQYSFIQGIEHLLPSKSSICDILLDDSSYELNGQKISFVKQLFQSVFSEEYEESGKKNKKTKKKKKKKNSDQEPPSNVFPDTCEEFFRGAQTIFIPNDEVIKKSLSPLQERYYLSSFHSLNSTKFATTDEAFVEVENDIFSLLKHHILKDLIFGANGTTTKKSHASIDKSSSYLIKLNQTSIIVNDKIKSIASYLASDAAVHIFGIDSLPKHHKFFQSLNIPTVSMIPRKGLFALHFSNFVKELTFRSLEYLIDGSTSNQTLFIERDQKDDIMDDDDEGDFMTYSFSSKQNLLYQFAEEPVDLSNITVESKEYHKLLDSKLCSKKRIGGCFKLKLSSSKYDGEYRTTLNDDIDISDIPIDLGNNTMVYIADSEISTPDSFKHSVGALMSDGSIHRHLEHIRIDQETCLTTMQYLSDFNLFSLDENNKGYSVFLPCGSNYHSHGSWKDLGLVLNYLESNPALFRNVLQGMFIEDTIYSDFGLDELDGENKSVTVTNLNGSPVTVENYSFKGGYDHVISLNNSQVSLPLNSDILFNEGVIHIINKVILPQDFSIPFVDLIKTTINENYPGYSILDLIELFPKVSKALGLKGNHTNHYSLLVPSPESLRDFNITTEFTRLLEFLEFHLIPNDQMGTLMDCVGDKSYHSNSTEFIISTNLTNTSLACYRDHKNDKLYLKLKEHNFNSSEIGALSYNKDHEVRLINYGCTAPNYLEGSCVFLIEKPLNLKWLEKKKDNFLDIHLGFISIGVGVILGLAIFGLVLLGAIFCLGRSRNSLDKPYSFDNDSTFPRAESSFMRVLTDDDSEDYDRAYDVGYETDLDMLRTESDMLLPLHGKRKRKGRKRDYGSTANGVIGPTNIPSSTNGTATRSIKINGISKTLNRERNIPGDPF